MTPGARPATDDDVTAAAIARSVIYASLFEYPLTLAQLRQSLLEVERSEADILRAYEAAPRLRETIGYQEGFFFPAGRVDLIAQRRRRETRSVRFLEEHRTVLNAICALPYVRMVALSGSVAHLNLNRSGDLDLFIVTRGRRVWSVTVAVIVLAKLLRRRHTVCANFVIADSRLEVDRPDLFTANQIVHLKPICGREVFDAFVAANPFVTTYYPNFSPARPAPFPFARTGRFDRITRLLERALSAPSAAAEHLCRVAYRAYLMWRSTAWQSPESVRLEPDYLKLHARSHRDPVLTRFDAAVADVLEPDERPTADENAYSASVLWTR